MNGNPHTRDKVQAVQDKSDGKGIRLVLGFSPGSASDQIASMIAPVLAAHIGERVQVQRMPGRNGADAAKSVAASVPDGRTLFVATLGTHAIAPHLGHDLGYEPLLDFAPVSLLTQSPLLLACHPSLSCASPTELIRLAKAGPGRLTFASSAVGGAPHLAAELFQTMAEIELRHTPYTETEQVYRALEAGRVSLSFNNMMSMLPRCRRGMLRGLAVTSANRSDVAPDIPTISESALKGYEVVNWLGVVAPKMTPPGMIARLGDAVASTMRADAVRKALLGAGIRPCGSTPAEFGDFISREIERWRPVVTRFRETAQGQGKPQEGTLYEPHPRHS